MTPHPIRRLGAADAAAYREFRLRALRNAPTAFTSSYADEIAKPPAATVRRLTTDTVLGAHDRAGVLVGIAGLRVPVRHQERHKGTLFGMAVAPEATGRGVGTALVREILAVAARVGLTRVLLSVSDGNGAAQRLYDACGFEVWGREPCAVVVAGRAVTKVHMVCVLDTQSLG